MYMYICTYVHIHIQIHNYTLYGVHYYIYNVTPVQYVCRLLIGDMLTDAGYNLLD